MALPFARAALVKYVTDKVIENVAKQMARPAAVSNGQALVAPPDAAAIVDHLNAGLIHFQNELAALESRLDRIERRMNRMERRWGWGTMFKIVVAVAVAFAFGFGLAQMFRLGGWTH